MVIILQQTSENGSKFVSTVVDTPQETSYATSFSLNSQLSISERSAVYKKRIDSLFGRSSKPRQVLPNGESFQIRVDGFNVDPTRVHMGPNRTILPTRAFSTPVLTEENEDLSLTTSEEDEYARICDTTSIITDSLNHSVKLPIRKGNGKCGVNVSSVRITCDDSESSTESQHSQLQHLMLTSSSGEEALAGRSETVGQRNMWKNSNYGESSPRNVGRIQKPFSTVRCSPGGILQFSVDYLGSIPVKGNTAALQDLQMPLRSLYMNYLTKKNTMTGQLAITSDGLRFEAPKVRLVNPFTTIAIWAAVKFVGRGEPLPTECAFMPLISDPEGQDKSRLFTKMDTELCTIYQDCVGDCNRTFKNPPIFACVMREATFTLDCHAFACKCAEDAIVIAANLYQSLVDKMKSGKEGESGYGSLNRGSPTTQSSVNQNRSSSSASSVAGTALGNPICNVMNKVTFAPKSSSTTPNETRAVFSDSESIAPIRPPRKKKKSSEIPSGNLKRYNSDDSVLLNIPYRRRSIKGGHQGHYIKNKKRVQIHTPDEEDSSGDSFSDSVDQILDRIVNPCGMSFNDLKPAYQELILKIALTLTQDQLYKKSKQAMKKQQKSRKKQKSPHPSSADASDDNSQFVQHFLKSISKINLSGKSVPISKRPVTTKAFLSSGLNARQKTQKLLSKPPIAVPSKAILKKPSKEEEIPFMSFCSGCVCEKCSDKCYCSLPSKQALNNGRPTPVTPTSSSTTAASTPSQHPNSSSAADTDAPRSRKSCGFDTDSCAESEKCYCSLQRVKSNGLKIYNINLDTETSDTDTNSYDFQVYNNLQLNDAISPTQASNDPRQVEVLSYHPSRRLSYCFSPTAFSQRSVARSCASVLAPTPRPDCDSRQAHATIKRSNQKTESENAVEKTQPSKNKVLLITGSNASGQVVYKDVPFRFRPNFGNDLEGVQGRGASTNSPEIPKPESKTQKSDETPGTSSSPDKRSSFAPERLVSMKKTAEIAAMFTNMKIAPPAEFALGAYNDIEDATQHDSGSIDFETSLGYLP